MRLGRSWGRLGMTFNIKQVQLKDLLLEPTRNGLTKPKAIRGRGVPMIAMGEIFANNRIFSFPMERVPVTDKELSSSSIYEGDLLFARQSLVLEGAGKCCIVKEVNEPTVFESHLIRVRLDNSKALSDYIYYYFNSYQGKENIKTIVEQVAAAGIRGSDLVNLYIPIPPITVQQQILQVLMNIDDKIAINTTINENLESQAYLLLEQMLSTPHDDICTLSDIANINPRYTLPKGSEARYIDMSQLSTTASFPGGWAFRSYNGGMKFKNKDTIIARITPCLENGKTAYIDFLKENEIAFGSTEYIVLSPKDNIPPELLYCIVRYPEFRTYAKVNMNGSSGRQRVSGEIIGKYEIPSFTQKELSKFGAVAEPLFKQITENSLQNRNLSVLRDALLPKLMKGEIDVSEVKI